MAFRILWHDGWPYPVTGHPFRPDAEEAHWFLQTRDGTWRPIVRREAGATINHVWDALEPVVRDWLAVHVGSDSSELPPMLVVEAALHQVGRGLKGERCVLARTVNTDRGQCYVELTTASIPSAVIRHEENRDPALFNVTFRTTGQPLGVRLQFDATEFLETIVQRYLHHRPTETPISRQVLGEQGQ